MAIENIGCMEMNELLRIAEVQKRTGLSRSCLYEAVARGEFPKPVKIGKRASAWVAAEIDQWIKQRVAARNTEQHEDKLTGSA